MPCMTEPRDAYYSDPDPYHGEGCKVQSLLDELETGKLILSNYNGSHPNFSSVGHTRKEVVDVITEQLCGKLREIKDIKQFSPEMQIWWRDHQEWDRKREEQEKEARRLTRLRASAARKLSVDERNALGIDINGDKGKLGPF